ncbi:oxidative damage protection protein [Coxiella endosymbiont of Amblyomma americanum]|uniref:oxidative damage protection protein n=1 Tax=Coxiella endosymbiont of Amblyomma americanum TaxID=325775 RepID=UPI0005807253|nr:oxidative damage protection protein [Coxiella endosymbiont of Amblyomma americanum]AJC50582.1 Fe-S cluster protector protein [Coxiella endosymbiont of Amblyomma americanum]AUJ58914.1 Fe(2+)-trafficking protein [Coxiella-like endosymbiont of Amblyomma americanum]
MDRRRIFCIKLDKEAYALNYRPYPGELGERIYNQISEQAWQLWLQYQTMLINEYRLNLIDPDARCFLEKEMKKFLFGISKKSPERD